MRTVQTARRSAAGQDPNDATNAPLPPNAGMSCDIINLYQGKEDKNRRWNWTTEFPDDLEKAAENETTARYAILVRNKKVFGDSRKSMEIDSIVIQSPMIKKALGEVLKDYPGVTTTLERLTFQADFKPFVHRWEEFTRVLNEEEDEETKSHIKLLHTTLEKELKETLAAKHDFIANKVITFDHLWTLYPPGCTVYTVQYARDCALKLTSGAYGSTQSGRVFSLNCQQIEWDGSKFGALNVSVQIPGFGGTKAITKLEAFPIIHHPNQRAVEEALFARGKIFERLHGHHFKSYQGIAYMRTSCGTARVQIDSRVVVDAASFIKFNPNSMTPLQAIQVGLSPSNSSTNAKGALSDTDSYDYAEEDSSEGETDVVTGKKKRRVPLTPEQLRICTPLVKGYALKTKRWLSFQVDLIREVKFSDTAFESLVLPEDQKELILAFAESQLEYKETFDDVIEGKGKGIILLLKGPPGTGKTLTAESVSETMRVPLYSLAAGDLGLDAQSVESSLTTILEMVAKWNAVLLLDECDVFLEARDSINLERNKLVSIFLRTLEYYTGILFLTTNRVSNMDAAFQSRIHVSMEYPDLNVDSRKHVWKGFLSRGIKHELTEEHTDTLADIDLNGRQIKNILKTSQLLACRRKESLQFSHLKTVLNIDKRGQVLGKRAASSTLDAGN